ncbi:MAG TPA: hypothetical protein DEO65_14680 [Bacillus bacterium]|uniref:Uncharacterized protein n=1 Tax=Siminovitchia fordii TaxID=254759 RepID=A0ABQ4KCV2_9BACI|nr:hypothetical protein [Siminovitchia fordii]GIN23010.1 hypothetical protein J1TS3_41440 [Siminovitchia fordii]HBZ11094.1 hypothetical protein [Bacillus sp. (in: firmicutes)]
MFNRLFKNKRNLSMITLGNLEKVMVQYGFDGGLIKEILEAFQKRMREEGEENFQVWYSNLDYTTPEEFQNEEKAMKMYERYSPWFDQEIFKLEKETGLSWQEQTEDIASSNKKARKSQLVLRHRLSEINWDLMDLND